MRVVIFAVFLAGCAIDMRTQPAHFQLCAFYCRQTDCPGDVPAPLPERKVPPGMYEVPPDTTLDAVLNGTDDPPADRCRTMEVGPKTLAQVISAIGTALAAWFGA